MPQKRIAINGFFLTRPYSGIGTYTQNLLSSLSALDKKNDYLVLVPQKVKTDLPKNFKTAVIPYKSLGSLSIKKWFWEQFQVPKFCKKNKVDLLHSPYPANPYSGFLRKFRIKSVVTVHDVIPWVDERYTKKLRSRIYQAFAFYNLRFAKEIIAVSKTTKKELQKLLKKKKKIAVIYNTNQRKGVIIERKRAAKKKLKIDRPYFLYVGGYDVRKNVSDMIDAFLDCNHSHNFQLVLAGKSYVSNLFKVSAEVKGDLVYTGFVSSDHLKKLYKNCHAFINFSEAEGFNLPLLEAAKAGANIATSDIPVHREVLGKSALFANPHRESSMEAAIKELMQLSKIERKKLSDIAREQAKKFNWREEGKKIINLYQSLLK